MTRVGRVAALVGVGFLAVILHAGSADAQAWVPYQGNLNVGLSYNFGFADTLTETDGDEFEDIHISSHTFTLSAEYVPIDRLAVDVSLPLGGFKYDKDASGDAYAPHGDYDDGDTHFTLTDLRADVRYMIVDDPIGLSVNLGVTIPVADYEVQGSAAAGRHLKQGRIGLAAGAFLPFAPRAFVHGTYELTLSEKFDEVPTTDEFGQTRSDITAQLGYFVLDTLNLYLMSTIRIQHDGVDFADFATGDLTDEQVLYHDPILRERAVLLGLGASYELTETLKLDASYSHFLGGNNTLNTKVVGVGVSWDVL
jgi:hypothetical protein